jgi:diguanylate cyclase (GGDEF)-like protein
MSHSLSTKVKQLRKTFLDRLPVIITDLRRLCLDIGSEGTRAVRCTEIIEALHRGFHRIKGTAASFGLSDIAEESSGAETLLYRLKASVHDHGQASLNAALLQVQSHLDRLEVLYLSYRQQEKDEAHFIERQIDTAPQCQTQQRKKIFLCDSDLVQTEKLALQIACFGYEVRVFNDTATLKNEVRRAAPDAIVMDIIFAEGASIGAEAISGLSKDSGFNIPVVFLSSREDFDARLQAVRVGGLAYLHKPLKINEMVEALDHLTNTKTVEPLRIMIVDDDSDVAAYHAYILEQAGMVTCHMVSPDTIFNALAEFNPDLILMDMYMPKCSGRDLSCVIRQTGKYISLPIIYLSSETDRNTQISALQTVGAEGFLTKPVKPDELVSVVSLRAERMRVLRSLMVRDSLTGLFNHTFITQVLSNCRHEAERNGGHFCFAMLDLDHFKSVNDTYGHPAGDQVLVALSRLLQQRLRGSDMVGRYGGEEFALILRSATLDQGIAVVDSIRHDFSRICFQFMGQELFFTFSAGVAAYPDFRGDAELTHAADQALYAAKHKGRNQVLPAVLRDKELS